MATCYNILCGLPVVGMSIVGALAFSAFFFFTSPTNSERRAWLVAMTFGSLVFVSLMFMYGG